MRADLDAQFEEFVAATAARLHRAAYAVTRDAHLAEDVVQSALARAYARWPRVVRTDQPEAYVRRIVVNEAISWRRRRSSGEVATGDVDERIRDRAEGHDKALTESDAMWQALGRLPARQRAVVVLRYYEHLSEAEIADTLRVRPGTVKSQCSAALATLRRLLAAGDTKEERV